MPTPRTTTAPFTRDCSNPTPSPTPPPLQLRDITSTAAQAWSSFRAFPQEVVCVTGLSAREGPQAGRDHCVTLEGEGVQIVLAASSAHDASMWRAALDQITSRSSTGCLASIKGTSKSDGACVDAVGAAAVPAVCAQTTEALSMRLASLQREAANHAAECERLETEARQARQTAADLLWRVPSC